MGRVWLDRYADNAYLLESRGDRLASCENAQAGTQQCVLE